MDLYKRNPHNGGDPDSIVLFLHGLGADGTDLIGIAQYWAEELPNTLFLSPDAPEVCDMMPEGAPNPGRQWFSLKTWTPESVYEGVTRASRYLGAFMDHHLEENNLPAEKIALVGFSQGAMVGLYTALSRKSQIACICAYSGALVGDQDLAERDHISKPPVFLRHGKDDMVVPVSSFKHAKKALENLGVTVTGEAVPNLAHGIDDEGIKKGGAFLKSYLGQS